MDATESPRVVIEAPAACPDGARAEERLRSELASVRAPARGWTVKARWDRDTAGRLRVAGEITDASGRQVAHRELTDATDACGGLARGLGIWAGLVLESEVEQASAASEGPVPSIGAAPAGAAITASRTSTSYWPPPEPPPTSRDTPSPDAPGRTLEFGAGVFLMSGTGGGGLAGPVLHAVFESGDILLRPSIAVGQSLASVPPSDVSSTTWGAARLDACLRVPGHDQRRTGMQLDLCGGADAGVTHVQALVDSTIPYVAVGPSLDLRGELGAHLSAVLRGVAGFEIVRRSFQDLSGATELPPLATARLELAFSWDVR